MKYQSASVLLAFFGLAIAVPVPEEASKSAFPPARMLRGREVPQEHSHEQFLTTVRFSLDTNNPAQITDPVFGLLGNAAASGGKGQIADPTCLQMATADQAFTNAKNAGDVGGQVAALIYRALERNTGGVGVASAPCTSINAVNPEIAAISQHQDPASPGAAAINKAIVLELAKQIKAVGGNPQDALGSGTFAAGNTNDSTGKGNSCDTANDPQGCIFSLNLLVPDATAAEINAAVAGAAAAPSPSTTTPGTPKATASAPATAPASGSNVQTFTGALGGLAPPVIFTAGAARPFAVDGTTDINQGAALQRSCDVQHNACANAANSGTLAGGEQQCETQHASCLANAGL